MSDHNGVFVAESEQAVRTDPYLSQAVDPRVTNWNRTHIEYSGVDVDGNIFTGYWVPRPPAESYQLNQGYQ